MVIGLYKKIILKKFVILLIFILLIGGIFRFYHIDKRSLWYDEYTYIGSGIIYELPNKNFKTVIIEIAEDRHAPLYYLILSIWIGVFGDSELALRIPSVMFGILSILIIFYIGKELFNHKVGLISSFLLSINLIHIIFSQEGKMYSLLLFLSLLSNYFFIKLIKDENIKNTILFIISTSLMLYTHNFGIFILVLQVIYLIYLLRKNGFFNKKVFMSQITAFLIFIPWIILLLNTKNLSEGTISIGFSYCSILDKFYSFSAGGLLIKARIFEMSFNKSLIDFFFNHNFFDLFYLGKTEFFLYIIYLTLFVVGIMYILKKFNQKNQINVLWFILIWLFIPLILKFFISLRTNDCDLRFALFSLPAFLLIVASGINNLKKRRLKIATIILISALFFAVYYKYDTWYSESTFVGPYWQLGQFIPENATNKEIAEYISFNSEPNLFSYIKIQKEAFKYIDRKYPNTVILTDWITAFKLSSPIHGWVKEPLTTLDANLNIAEVGSNEFDLILKIKGDGFDYRKSDLADKALNKFNVILIKEWKYKNMSIEIYENIS